MSKRILTIGLVLMALALVGLQPVRAAAAPPIHVLVLTEDYLPLNSFAHVARGTWDIAWFLQYNFRDDPRVQIDVLRDEAITARLPGMALNYDLFVFLDVSAARFPAGELERIAQRVKAGAGLVMIGGEASFEGRGDKPSHIVGKLGGRTSSR